MPAELKCKCGQLCAPLIFRSGLNHHLYYRCTCGQEWSLTETVDSLSDPVSSSEVLEVHRLLTSDKTLKEITDQ